MVWPILAAVGLATIFTSVRAGRRALLRLRQMPPEAFGLINDYDARKPFHPGGFDDRMTVEEAKLILGITDLSGLTANQLRKKHRETMIHNHPDRGGSAYIAMKINEARDVIETQKGLK